MTDALARAEYVVARWGPWLVVALLAVAAVAAGVAATAYTDRPTTQVTDTVDSRTVNASMHVRATASGDTALYDAGQSLVDQPVYLRASTQSVTLRVRTGVEGGERVDARQRLALVYEVSRQGETFWRSSQQLSSTDAEGAAVTSEATLSVASVRERLRDIRADLDGAGVVRTAVVLNVTYDSGGYAGSFTERTPLRLAPSWFAVRPLDVERRHRRTETKTVAVPGRGASGYRWPALAAALSLVGAAAVGYRYRIGPAVAASERHVHEHRYGQWISTGRLGGGLPEGRVRMGTLEGLVDVAIDADRRVVHDIDNDLFVVVAGDVVYYFEGEEGDWPTTGQG